MERLKSVRTTAGARPVRNRYEGKGYYYLRGGDFFPELIEEMNAGNGASDLCLKELDRRGMEKPRDFDPFGQAGFAHLWLQYD